MSRTEGHRGGKVWPWRGKPTAEAQESRCRPPYSRAPARPGSREAFRKSLSAWIKEYTNIFLSSYCGSKIREREREKEKKSKDLGKKQVGQSQVQGQVSCAENLQTPSPTRQGPNLAQLPDPAAEKTQEGQTGRVSGATSPALPRKQQQQQFLKTTAGPLLTRGCSPPEPGQRRGDSLSQWFTADGRCHSTGMTLHQRLLVDIGTAGGRSSSTG